MKRYITSLWIVALLVGMVGCATTDESKLDHKAISPQEQVTGIAGKTDNSSNQALQVTMVGVPTQLSMNPFPADFGPAPLVDGRERPVPQDRGLDHRPLELAPEPDGITTPSQQTVLNFATLPAGTLVLYDSTGPYGWLGELYGIASLNLASHFGATASKPVVQYKAGDLAKYKAVIYVGSTYDEPLPVAFLDDVLKSSVPVIWMYDNIWQLANRATDFVGTYGYNPWAFDVTPINQVVYKGTVLTRDANNGSGIMQFSPFDPSKTTTLATALRSDGSTIPWAVRSGNLTYIGEVPFAYIDHNDRYLAFCDLLFDALAPTTAVQHRALLRLEDVSPMTDPVSFRAIVDYLYSAGVPFGVAVIPLWTDPLGAEGPASTVKWSQKPQMLAQLKYALAHGGTLVMHGYTHQYGSVKNPYSGVSGDDFEFFVAHVDAATNNVIYDGAVANDSSTWALGRITLGLAALKNAGLASPTIFEYPHYAGSATDSKAIRLLFGTVYHRGLYFGGSLGLSPSNIGHSIGLFYPYTVTDIYGWKVKPENLGNYEPDAYNNHPPRLAADLISTAKNNLVIRDGAASFFFHPYAPLTELQTVVAGIQAAGYKFVGLSSF